ncbi:hypothetical protein DM860_007154 [Cuscuta australis]|uniref:coproporphyrinogen oxidase n=1 Tax=Cuscuta australis TaxID=267555 RepID=A0A328E6C0_9ASTE|nr:hypothetical protein DM860_007154 [Cuscuta australis]
MLTSAILSLPRSSSTSAFPPPLACSGALHSSCSLATPTLRVITTASKSPSRNRLLRLRGQASSSSRPMIEKETPESQRPESFLRDSDNKEFSCAGDETVRARFEKMIREVQDGVCSALEAVDGGGNFAEDVWSRPGGGGGISRVLQDGNVFEKAGVNVSVVYGVMPPEAYRAAKPSTSAADDGNNLKPGPVPFFAAGISSVLHPKNPFAPTLHFNYRYFETDAPKGGRSTLPFGKVYIMTHPPQLPPELFLVFSKFRMFKKVRVISLILASILDSKNGVMIIFILRAECLVQHRGERRGLGGIFFDDLNNYDQEMLLSFATECANSVIPAYIPIVEKRKDMPFTDSHKAWQQLRRGRYVEFNLVYDRGTTFGLKTGGRIESILVSLPLTARWEYDHKPREGTEEWRLLDACINPKDWI